MLLAAGDPLGATPDGAGDATPADGDGAADGDGGTDGATDAGGEGAGRKPTGSGPTSTIAARIPTATRTPTRRPARIVIPVFMRRQGTSTDGRQRLRRNAARLTLP